MRALLFTAYGGPEVLTWGDAPVPHAGPGQIRIAVRAASVNPVDWKMLAGAMSGGQAPGRYRFISATNAAGVVDEVGEGGHGGLGGLMTCSAEAGTRRPKYAVLDAWGGQGRRPSTGAVAAAAGPSPARTSERGLRLLGVRTGDTIFVDGWRGRPWGAVAVQMAGGLRGRGVIASGERGQPGLPAGRSGRSPCCTAGGVGRPRPAAARRRGGSTRCSTVCGQDPGRGADQPGFRAVPRYCPSPTSQPARPGPG